MVPYLGEQIVEVRSIKQRLRLRRTPVIMADKEFISFFSSNR